jgi:hypothetical protein
MAIQILNGGANSVTPPGPYTRAPDGNGYVDCHSCGRNPASVRVTATGGFTGDTVSIQQSPDSGVTWIAEGVLANNGELTIERPIDWLRAVAGPALIGTAKVYAEASA